jgi:hypothetical protein
MPDLAEQIRRLIDESAPPVTLDEIGRARSTMGTDAVIADQRLGAAPRRRWVRPALAAALVVAVVGTGSWMAASRIGHPAKTTISTTRVPATAWQLTAELSGPQFQLATGNPDAVVGVDCSGGSTCFLSTGYGLGGAAASVPGSTYVSHDSGHTWQATVLPSGVATTTLASCVSSTWCAAGGGLLDPSTGDPAAGKEMRDPELLITTDAGATWTVHPVPILPNVQQLPAYGNLPAETTYWPATVDAVSCSAPQVCSVVAHVDDDVSSPVVAQELVFLHTSDGGAHWTSTVLPERSSESGFEVQQNNGVNAAMACPSQSNCVVVATLAILPGVDGVVDAWRTTDGGQSWQETQVTGISGAGTGISCPDSQDCWAGPSTFSKSHPSGVILHSIDGGATWSLVAVPSFRSERTPTAGIDWSSVSCTSAKVCFLSGTGMAETTDGGATWQHVSLPPQVGGIPDIACSAQGGCVAVAVPASPAALPSPYGGSLILTNNPGPSDGSGS